MNKLERLIHASSQRLTAQNNERADRARISVKFAFAHARRSQGQKDRQLRERIARIFADTERTLTLIEWRYRGE